MSGAIQVNQSGRWINQLGGGNVSCHASKPIEQMDTTNEVEGMSVVMQINQLSRWINQLSGGNVSCHASKEHMDKPMKWT